MIFSWLSTGPGGAEESLAILVATLATRCGLSLRAVQVIVWQYDGATNLRPAWPFDEYYQVCYSYEQYRATMAACLAESPDQTVFFTNYRTFALDLALAAGYNGPTALIFRGLALLDGRLQLILPDQQTLTTVEVARFDWATFERADAIIAVSQAGATALQSRVNQPERVGFIYNPLRPGSFSRPATVRPRVTRFLMMARLVEWKALSVGLAAFLTLWKDFPYLELNIVGDGPRRTVLQESVLAAHATQAVHFQGWQPDPTEWYRASDCLLHPCPTEGFGRVVAEANACGLPAIVPDAGGVAEQVVNGRTGFTFYAGEPNSCYQAMLNWLNLSPAARLAMAQAAQKRAGALFDALLIANQYEALADRLLLTKAYL